MEIHVAIENGLNKYNPATTSGLKGDEGGSSFPFVLDSSEFPPSLLYFSVLIFACLESKF